MTSFLKIHDSTSAQRYMSIIAFIKNYELEIRKNENIGDVEPKIDVGRIKNIKLRTAITNAKFYSMVRQSSQPAYIATKQFSFLLRTDSYLYEQNRQPEDLHPTDIDILFMLSL